MNPEIFREYDIRGIADQDFNDADVVLLGKGIGTYLIKKGCTRLTLGQDCRTTSKRYSEHLTKGLLSIGCDVTDIGVCTSPMLYYSIQHLNMDGGVMITASHNPKEYNGFKVCKGLGSVYGEQLKKISDIIESTSFVQGSGVLSHVDITPSYMDFIQNNITLSRPLRVGIDAGNGTAGVVALPILKHLNCEVHDLYCDMDGTFPNHEADPTVAKNMKDLIAMVKEKHLDLGIGYDGDGDRLGVVDENGQLVYGDKLIILFAREILSRKPGATFISEVKCSKAMYDDIEKHGGRAIMWKTGHSLIKEKMKVEKAELAGEMSGHIFFADRYFGFDDAIYASCRLLEILSRTDKKLSELLHDVPKTFSTPEIRIECPDNIKFKIVERVTEHFRKSHNVIDIDGVRVLLDDGWGLVRASNTQPAIVMRFEAMSEKRLHEIKTMIETVLHDIQNRL